MSGKRKCHLHPAPTPPVAGGIQTICSGFGDHEHALRELTGQSTWSLTPQPASDHAHCALGNTSNDDAAVALQPSRCICCARARATMLHYFHSLRAVAVSAQRDAELIRPPIALAWANTTCRRRGHPLLAELVVGCRIEVRSRLWCRGRYPRTKPRSVIRYPRSTIWARGTWQSRSRTIAESRSTGHSCTASLSGASRNRCQGATTRTVQCACYGIGVECAPAQMPRDHEDAGFRARIVVMNPRCKATTQFERHRPTRYGTPRSVSAA